MKLMKSKSNTTQHSVYLIRYLHVCMEIDLEIVKKLSISLDCVIDEVVLEGPFNDSAFFQQVEQ